MRQQRDPKAAYEAALDYLYESIKSDGRHRLDRYRANKVDATRPLRLMQALGNPHQQFPTIHIAGTKGKGSVSALCASALRAAGYRVGLYTSPHLVDFRERIRILTPNDKSGFIPKAAFTQIIAKIQAVEADVPHITWFEILTATAFLHFAAAQVDIAVVEVGLGGRLDATNVLTPLVSVITTLSLDHTQLLGDTLTQIAREKGGIIKPGVPVISAQQTQEAMRTLRMIATQHRAPFSAVGQAWRYQPGQVVWNESQTAAIRQTFVLTEVPDGRLLPKNTAVSLPLLGDHQQENSTVALAALHAVQPQFPYLTSQSVLQGMAELTWNGRLQMVHQSPHTPNLLVDCAHNPDSAAKLRQALRDYYRYRQLHLILGAPADKDIVGLMQQLLPLATNIIVTTASHPRALTPSALARIVRDLGHDVKETADVAQALHTAWKLAAPDDLICGTGSIIVVGDLLNQWDGLQSDLKFSYTNSANLSQTV